MTASNGSLDRSCHSLLQKIFQKYDNVAEVDRLSQVTQKVESVKIVMQENVEMALANCVVLENIEQVVLDFLIFSFFSSEIIFSSIHTI